MYLTFHLLPLLLKLLHSSSFSLCCLCMCGLCLTICLLECSISQLANNSTCFPKLELTVGGYPCLPVTSHLSNMQPFLFRPWALPVFSLPNWKTSVRHGFIWKTKFKNFSSDTSSKTSISMAWYRWGENVLSLYQCSPTKIVSFSPLSYACLKNVKHIKTVFLPGFHYKFYFCCFQTKEWQSFLKHYSHLDVKLPNL